MFSFEISVLVFYVSYLSLFESQSFLSTKFTCDRLRICVPSVFSKSLYLILSLFIDLDVLFTLYSVIKDLFVILSSFFIIFIFL